MGLMLNANCCVGVSNPFAMYGSVLFLTNTPLHTFFGVGVWDTRPPILKWFSVPSLQAVAGTSMGYDEGHKMRVGLFVSWFFPSASLLCGREPIGWYTKLVFVPLR
jgi:hypothetical protein